MLDATMKSQEWGFGKTKGSRNLGKYQWFISISALGILGKTKMPLVTYTVETPGLSCVNIEKGRIN